MVVGASDAQSPPVLDGGAVQQLDQGDVQCTAEVGQLAQPDLATPSFHVGHFGLVPAGSQALGEILLAPTTLGSFAANVRGHDCPKVHRLNVWARRGPVCALDMRQHLRCVTAE